MASAVLPRVLLVPTRTCAVPAHHLRRRPNAPRSEQVRRASVGESGTPETSSENDDDVPEWAKDLALDENGDLIDTKTGKALNEFGATRFDVAVRAMRGEYDPPGVSTEMEEGQFFDMLTQFPSKYTFQASGRASDLDDDGVAHVANLLMEVCGCPVAETQIEIKPRGKKFVSLWVTCTVHSGEMVTEALRVAKADSRVMTCW